MKYLGIKVRVNKEIFLNGETTLNGFAVIIDASRMSVKLIAGDNVVNPISSEDALLYFLKTNKINRGISSNEILRAFFELPELKESKVYTVAEGKFPKNGKNGRLDFNVDVSGHSRYTVPSNHVEGEKVDYKSAMSIDLVSPGDLICTVIAPTVGVDGYDVEGRILSANDGKEATLVLGDGVEYDRDRSRIFATKEGRPVFLDKKLFISDIYEVRGDVNYSTGNIVFKGHVYISGMVEDDFSVEANSIEIRGSVGNSYIKSEGELVIGGGVNGHDSGHIKCNGNATIKYLNDANIEINGDLNVLKDIVNSDVKCNGAVSASRIVGGSTIALKGIKVNIAGSEIGTPTLMEVGINYRVKELNKALVNLSWQIELLISPFINNLGDRDYFKRVTPKIKKRILEAYQDLHGISKGYQQLLTNRMILSSDEQLFPICEVIIKKMLYSDVAVMSTTCHKDFISEFLGPIKLVESSKYKSFDIINYFEDEIAPHKKIEELDGEKKKYRPTGNVEKIIIDNISRIIYTKYGLNELENKFRLMVKGQDFDVCVYDDRHIKRVTLMNAFKGVGIENIYEVKDVFHAVEVLKNHKNEKFIFICNLHIGVEEGLKLVGSFLQNSEGNYSILLVDKISSKLASAVARIDSLEIFEESVGVEVIIKQIRDFGFEF